MVSLRGLVQRMASAWGLLVAVAVMATVSTTLTALVPVYSNSVVEAGFRTAVDQADPAARTVAVTLRTTSAEAVDLAAPAVAAADQMLAGSSEPAVFAESGAYQLPAADDSTITSLAALYDGTVFATVVATEPADATALPAALHVDAAAHLGVAVGSVVEVATRDGVERIEVVELVEPLDTTDPRWIGQPFGRDGVRRSASFTEIGPFFVEPDDFARRAEPVTLRGRFALAGDTVAVGDLDTVVSGVESARATFAAALGSNEVRVDTALAEVLVDIDTTVRTTGAVVGVILLQLVAVALYGLGVASSVLARSRDGETAILVSRGASRGQLARATLAESSVVVLPAVLLGPPLAVVVVSSIGAWDPVEATGLQLRGTITPVAIAVSVVVAAVSVAVITATSMSAAAASSDDLGRRSVLHRNGLDLVLIVVAVLGLWQLGRRGTVATSSSPDARTTIDPILALAPTLGVIAASLLALRLVTTAAQLLLRLGTRSPRLVPALAGWDMVRRPARQARTSVLIVVAVSIGVFAAVHADSWQRSQRDQADAATGSDVTVQPDTRPDADVPARALAAAYSEIDGVDAVLPVETRAAELSSALSSVTLVAVDATRLDGFSRMRADLRPTAGALAALPEPLDTGGATLDGAGDLTATVTVTVEPAADTGLRGFDLGLVVRDEFGTVERLSAGGPLVADGVPTAITFGSIPPVTDGSTPTLVGVELTAPTREVPLGTPADEFPPPLLFEVAVTELRSGDRPVDTSALDWRLREVTTDGSTTRPGTATATRLPDGVLLSLDPGTNRRDNLRVAARFTTAQIEEGAAQQEPLPIAVLATPALLGRSRLAVGDEASIRLGGLRVLARIAGTTPVVPFASDERFALLVDRPTLTSVELTTLGTTGSPDRWAINTGEETHREVSATLAAAPFNSVSVADRRIEAERRSRDPVLVGLTGSLFAAVLAAAVVVVLGLLLTAVTEAREGRSGYAVLRALGLSRAELRRLLVRETVPLAIVATACGVVAGLVLADLTVSSLTSDRDGSAALPIPEVIVPWPTIAAFVAVTFVAVAALPLLTGRLLRRVRPADELRIGDQR